ncbi:MAG TPA: YggT family protein [Burkholderiales bacterium]|nr:YggT family protein [Burkholderiales bacterium]
MLSQIVEMLVDSVAGFFVFLLLARFHMQWLRVPFRNQLGQFVVAATNWIVRPARRVVPALAGYDFATLVAAWLLQAFGLFLILAVRGAGLGAQPGAAAAALLAVALVDLLRYSLYILSFAVVIQAVLSWVNPYTPLGPVFDAFTRPFLRPLQRRLPLVANVDLSPLVLLVVLQVLLIPVWYLRALAGGVG